jgi:hypothetical protein
VIQETRTRPGVWLQLRCIGVGVVVHAMQRLLDGKPA